MEEASASCESAGNASASAAGEAVLQGTSLQDTLQKIFDLVDLAHSGFASASALEQTLLSLGAAAVPRQISDILRAIDADPDGNISAEQFFDAMQSEDCVRVITAASHASDVVQKLDEIRQRHIGSFLTFVDETLAFCQQEMLAAKVPMSSFGRVKTAIDHVNSAICGTARSMLEADFAELHDSLLRSMQGQKTELEASCARAQRTAVAAGTREAVARAELVDSKLAEVKAEVEELKVRHRDPEELIGKLRQRIEDKEAELEKAAKQVAKLEAAASEARDDWQKALPRALSIASSIAPAALRNEPPFIRLIESRYTSPPASPP